MRRSVAGFIFTILLLAMNSLDAALTLWWWERGLSDEVNPLVRMALEVNPYAAMGAKLVFVNSWVVILWMMGLPERMPRIFAAIWTIYFLLILSHLGVIFP